MICIGIYRWYSEPGSLSRLIVCRRGIAEGIRYYSRGLASDQKKLKEKVLETMHLVGLSASYYQKKCRELSGGECQRAAIGRAIIRSPRLLICDEVTSALDVSIQAQIMQLLFSLKKEMGMAMLLFPMILHW